MPHFPKPFFRKARSAWFVQLRGKWINLGPDRDKAFSKYHELMALPVPVDHPIGVPGLGRVELVVAVVDAFLNYVQHNRSAETYRWYKDRLQRFVNSIPAALTLGQLKPFHVQNWIDSYPDHAPGTKRNYCRSIQRAMHWAEDQGYIDKSPLAHLKKPRGGRKEQVVSTEQFASILVHTKDQAFTDLLTVTWETGARPQETLRVEARHVDLPNARWVFPASEAKGGKLPRVIYLTHKAVDITRRLLLKHPFGPLFRNTDGLPWTPDATNCRFQTLKKKLKVKFSLYALRHTWINRMLMSGVDALTVAVLAGHSDPSTLAKHYQHLSQSPSYLLGQMRKATG